MNPKSNYGLCMNGVGYYYSDAEAIEVILTKGQEHCYPWHMHTRHWTIGAVRHGAAFLTTEQGRQRFCPGHYFCIPPYKAHSLYVEPGSLIVVTCFDAQGALLLKKSPDTLEHYISGVEPEERGGFEKVTAFCEEHDFSRDSFEKYLPAPASLLEPVNTT